MSECDSDAMDKVSAALTCGAADKDKPAARMLPKGTSGRGGISNPPCMADAKEEMPKEKQQEMFRLFSKLGASGGQAYMDYLGNKLVDGATGTGNETSLEYTYAPGKEGTYRYTVKIGESSCTKQRTVSSPIELKCQDITEQNASDMITVNPTVNNCTVHDCDRNRDVLRDLDAVRTSCRCLG